MSQRLSNSDFRKPKPDKARLLAYDLISQVNQDGAYANIRLPDLLKVSQLEQRDKALATELSYGTLRMQGRYDYFIAQKIDRSIAELDPKILNLLRMGMHQIDYMRTPDHAAVSATVEVARFVAGESKASYVNAILRAITRDTNYSNAIAADSALSATERLSIEYSHPEWIVKAFYDQLKDWDKVEELLRIDNLPVAPHLVAWPGKSTVENLLETGGRELPLSSYAIESDHLPSEYPEIESRRAGVQDLGSQIVAETFYNTAKLSLDSAISWLDMCAGPGGKAALLYNLVETSRPQDIFTANEPTAHRAELVARVVPSSLITQNDGRDWAAFGATYDRILVDAPCTGLGALRRRPEARWRRTPNDLKNLVALQRQLLDSAYELLNPGGVIGYATCSPHIAETMGQILDFTHRHKDMKILSVADFVKSPTGGENPDGTLQLWSHIQHSDSMYLALLQKPL
ncbi:unannotated protein [freshwater metagenome]|uniref:Unannotated protein n=1 Tax=freshwater metagenome TaxID=449393 RepID=A0A6J6B0W8_9ZZZZ